MEQSNPVTITLQIVSNLDEVTRGQVPHVVDFTVLQLNDAYEAAPVEGGRLGGLARVATLRRQLAAENPRLLTVMIGDFLNPSAISTITGDGGQHMIEALNAMGLSHATVGNHEFDLAESDLLLRIEDSKFKWIVSNVSNGAGAPFAGVARNEVVTFANDAGEQVRVALVGFCLDMVKKPWIRYQNVEDSARQQVEELAGKADVFVAMTHLTIGADMALGAAVPRLDVLLGGHEHEAATAIVGADATPIFKADSNARSVCIHRFRFDTQTRVTKLFTELRVIDASFAEEPATKAVVDRWQAMAYDSLRAQGFDPLEVIGRATESFDGYEKSVRGGSTNLTRLIAETFLAEVPGAEVVFFPSGQIRLDGVIPPGDIQYFEVVRIFPLGGKLSVLNMPGALLRLLLDGSEASRGNGGYAVLANVTRDAGGWRVGGEPLDAGRVYKVVFGEVPVAALAYAPFKGSGVSKAFDTRPVRAILADRLRADRAAGGTPGLRG